VRVNVRLQEGEGEKVKERLQAFEGVVISKKGRASSATFTVRRVSFGVGIERIFPLHSPTISSIEVVGKGKVRRARLYYLRDLKGKAARIKRAGREEVAAVPWREPKQKPKRRQSIWQAIMKKAPRNRAFFISRHGWTLVTPSARAWGNVFRTTRSTGRWNQCCASPR